MYEVLCEGCWETHGVEDDVRPEYPCPSCGAEGSWLGPFVAAPTFSRRDSWPVLTSPLYMSAGRTDRRSRPR